MGTMGVRNNLSEHFLSALCIGVNVRKKSLGKKIWSMVAHLGVHFRKNPYC